MSLNCTQCDGSGWVAATRRTDNLLFGFRCHCPRSNKVSEQVPSWRPYLNSAYKVNFIKDTPAPDYKAKAANPNDFLDDIPF